MSDILKVYSLDYIKEKKYSDDTTEDATRLECAGIVVGSINNLYEKGLLNISHDELIRVKTAVFMSVIIDTPIGDAYLNDTLLVVDGKGNEYTAGISNLL